MKNYKNNYFFHLKVEELVQKHTLIQYNIRPYLCHLYGEIVFDEKQKILNISSVVIKTKRK